MEIKLSKNINEIKIKKVPKTVIPLLECKVSNPKPCQPTFNKFQVESENNMLFKEQYPNFALVFVKCLLRNPFGNKLELYSSQMILDCLHGDYETEIPLVDSSKLPSLPPWSGFNSLVSSQTLPTTRIATLPLIASPAHEYNTLLTVLKQAQGINVELMGPNKKTVITFDLGLYKPVRQLQMFRQDFDDIVVRPGELHIMKAMLITIGGFINGSGLDLSWDQAEIFGECTTKQILDGNHIRRGQNAHLITVQSLLSVYSEQFLKDDPLSYITCADLADDLNQACILNDKEKI